MTYLREIMGVSVIINSSFLDYVTVVFSCLGALSFIWIVWKEVKSFLQITVSSEGSTIFTSISNNSFFKRKIEKAFIILTRQDSNLMKTMKDLFQRNDLENTNDFYKIKEKKIGASSAFIPIDFYISENIQIADETLTCSINLSKYDLKNNIYEVRFFVFPKSRKRLHRSTQCLIGITK